MLNITSSQRVLLEAEGAALHPDGAESTCRVLEMERGLLRRETVYACPGREAAGPRGPAGELCPQPRGGHFLHRHRGGRLLPGGPDPLVDGDVTNLVCTDDPRVGSGLHGRVLSLPRMGQAGDALGMVSTRGTPAWRWPAPW